MVPPSPLVLLKVFEVDTLSPDFGFTSSGLNVTIRRLAGSCCPDFCFVYSIVRVKRLVVDWKVACAKVGGKERILDEDMRRFASIAAILLLLAAAAPVMACLTSVAMSHEESACCRAMHGQCGQMAKMGCCQTQVRADDSPQIAAVSPVVSVHWVCVEHLSLLASSTMIEMSVIQRVPNEHSPPGLLTAKTTVLRI
jgi:hypothetical protein